MLLNKEADRTFSHAFIRLRPCI